MKTTEINKDKLPAATEAQKFIAQAEQAFNAKDLEAACADYAENAILELFTDGIQDIFNGSNEIRQAWKAIFKAIPHFYLEKKITTADQYTIVNEWSGTIDIKAKKAARGIEIWRFNQNGQVIQHTLYSFFQLYTSKALSGKIHFFLKHPIIGIQLEKERLKIQKNKNL